MRAFLLILFPIVAIAQPNPLSMVPNPFNGAILEWVTGGYLKWTSVTNLPEWGSVSNLVANALTNNWQASAPQIFITNKIDAFNTISEDASGTGAFYQQKSGAAFAKMNGPNHYGSIQNDSLDLWSLAYSLSGDNSLGTVVLQWGVNSTVAVTTNITAATATLSFAFTNQGVTLLQNSLLLQNSATVLNGSPGFFYQQNNGVAGYLMSGAGANYGKIQNDSADVWSLAHTTTGGNTLGTPDFQWSPTQLTAWRQIMASNHIIIDAAHYLYVSNSTVSRVAMISSANTITNVGVTGPINGDTTATTSSQVQSLFPGLIMTNGYAAGNPRMVASNQLAVSIGGAFFPSNATPSHVAIINSDNSLTNSGLGAVPINGDTTATTAAQISALVTINSSGFTNKVNSQSANYNIQTTDWLVLLTGAHTATLPTAVGAGGKEYVVKCSSAGTNAILTTSSQTIDGFTKYTNTAVNKFTWVISDNANWWVIGQN